MASKIQGITVEIGGDTTKLGNALQSVNSKAKNLQSELKGVNTLLKMDPTNVTLLKQKQDLLNKSIAECREKLNLLKSTQAQVQEQFEKGEITEEIYRDFQREIVATETKLKKLEKQAKSFGSVGAQQVAAVGTKMQNLGDSITNVGKKFTVVSTAASAALVGIAKSAIDFETAFTGVIKTVDGTDEQLENIRQGLFDLSEATASSATDIAAVAEAAGQLGVKTDNVLAFTETMIRLGDSTNLSADEAATAIAQLYNVMGSDINTVDQFGAALVALGNNAATTEADILNMATRIASSGSQVGLTEQQVLALATTLSSVGLEAEGGGSAISAVITQIDKDVALNSNTLKTWANVAGLSVKDFKNLWENDAMTAIQKVVAGMGDASAGGENLNVILDNLGVTSLRQTDTMKRLSSASELMSEMVGISNTSWEENTALTTESSKRYETTAAKMQQVKNTVTELCSKLGETLLPIIQNVCNSLSNFASWLTELNPTAQKIVLIVLAIVAAIGPLLITIGKLTTSIGSIMTFGPKILNGFGTIKTAISGLFKLILTNPVIAIITAIIAAIMLLWNNCEEFRNLVIGIFETIKTALNVVWEWISGIFNTIVTVVSSGIENIKIIFSNLWNALVTIFTPVVEFFQNLWNGIVNIFSVVGGWFGARFSEAWNAIRNVFSGVGNFFGNIWNTIKNMFTQIGTTVGNAIGNAFKTVVNSIINFAENTINKFIRAINAAIGLINNIPGVNIPKLNELNIPKLKVGMDYVPYDNYLALLHKGERVMTAKENKEYGKNSEVTKVIKNDNALNLKIENFYNNRQQDIQGLGEELGFYSLKVQRAKGG